MSWVITGREAGTLGLLDQYSNAALAYSLRSLSIYYTGPVVRVRRSSDNAEQDFTATQVSNGTLTTFCGVGNGFVQTWYDQSGNGRNAVQSTQAAQPQIVSSGSLITAGSKPSLQYSGAQNLSATHGITLNGSSTLSIIVVAYPLEARAANGQKACVRIPESGSWGSVYLQVATNGLQYRFGTSQTLNDVTVSASLSAAISQVFKEGVTEYARLNGVTYTRTGALLSLANNTSSLNIGQGETALGTGLPSFFNGKTSEVIFYSRTARDSASEIEANINAHYAVY
jgi:hypothetical protein